MIGAIRRRILNISDGMVMGILIGLFGGAVIFSLLSHFQSAQANLWVWADSFAQNFGTEMFGAFLTFVLIEVLVSGRRARQAEEAEIQELRQRLVRQLGSRINEEAVRAAEELEVKGWLEDGSLERASLSGANLQAAHLSNSDLRGAHLGGANLQGAQLFGANLQKADMFGTWFQGANLAWTNLQDAVLQEADLQGAYLIQANLQGVQGIEDAKFNEDTKLPDATRWTPETDLARFTDPDHPDFWRSDKPASPAYRGDDDDYGDEDEDHNDNN